MIKTVELINKITGIQGKGSADAKLKVIRDNIDNEMLKDIFAFNFDKDITTKVSMKKLTKNVDLDKAEVEIFDIYSYMSFLKNDCTGKDSHVATIKKFVAYCEERYSPEVALMMANLAMKGIKLGTLGRKGLAKVYGEDFLFRIESMGGQDWDKNKEKTDVEGKNIHWSLKIDGYRLHTFLNEDGTTDTWSRSGKKQVGYDIVEKELRDLGYPMNILIDYEVRLPKLEGETAGACFLRTQSVCSTEGLKEGLEARVFDMIPKDEFLEGKYKGIYEKRRAEIEAQNTSDMIKPTEILYVGNGEKEIEKLQELVVGEWLEEGLIGYVEGRDWKAGKSRRILKNKPFKDADLKIIGFELGDPAKKFSNTLGKVVVDWKGNGVGVGSGFDIPLRDEIWNNQEKYLGKIIEVRYLHESHDESGKPSLRHTSFQRFRTDKNTVSV